MAEKNNRLKGFPDDNNRVLKISVTIGAVLILGVIIFIIFRLLNPQVSTDTGLSMLQKMNSVSVSDVKAQIKTLENEEAEAIAKRKTQTTQERFADSVIMGDSSVQGFIDYCEMDESEVYVSELAGVTKVENAADSESSAAEGESSDTESSDTEGTDGTTDETGTDDTTDETDTTDTADNLFILDGTIASNSDENVDSSINDQIKKAVNNKKQNLFLSYGINDVVALGGDAETFAADYRVAIETLKNQLPDAEIYVLSIPPVRQNVIDTNAVYGKIDAFNAALQKVCREEHVTFMDNTSIMKTSYYGEDGITLTEDYYTALISQMEDTGDL